jgi:hypothetical protein
VRFDRDDIGSAEEIRERLRWNPRAFSWSSHMVECARREQIHTAWRMVNGRRKVRLGRWWSDWE